VDPETIRALGITREEIDKIIERESAEMERRLARFRGERPMLDLRDRTVILVDDGLATGVTANAAVLALRRMQPRKVVLAVPVGAAQTVRTIRQDVDDLVCLKIPHDFGAVGLWYSDFDQTGDDEVVRLLNEC
jgi:predicted phosphoribosyltransferase